MIPTMKRYLIPIALSAFVGVTGTNRVAAEEFNASRGDALQSTSARVVAPIRNKNIKIVCSLKSIGKESSKSEKSEFDSALDEFWQAYFMSICEKQMNSDGRDDGNSFNFFLKSDPKSATGMDFEFHYCFNDADGKGSLQMSGWDCGLIHEFMTNYGEETKVADIYYALNRQAYSWIHNGWSQPEKTPSEKR
jgi:hypothetical protein